MCSSVLSSPLLLVAISAIDLWSASRWLAVFSEAAWSSHPLTATVADLSQGEQKGPL